MLPGNKQDIENAKNRNDLVKLLAECRSTLALLEKCRPEIDRVMADVAAIADRLSKLGSFAQSKGQSMVGGVMAKSISSKTETPSDLLAKEATALKPEMQAMVGSLIQLEASLTIALQQGGVAEIKRAHETYATDKETVGKSLSIYEKAESIRIRAAEIKAAKTERRTTGGETTRGRGPGDI